MTKKEVEKYLDDNKDLELKGVYENDALPFFTTLGEFSRLFFARTWSNWKIEFVSDLIKNKRAISPGGGVFTIVKSKKIKL